MRVPAMGGIPADLGLLLRSPPRYRRDACFARPPTAKAHALAAEMARELEVTSSRANSPEVTCVPGDSHAVLAPIPAGSNDRIQPIEAGVISGDKIHAELG